MSPRTQEQNEQIRQERRQKIMDTALRLFGESSYQSTSIQKIAKEVGVSKGLLYNYFESKEELLQAIINEGMEELLDYFDPNKDGVLTKEELEQFVAMSFKTVEDNPVFWKLYMSLLMQQNVIELLGAHILETMVGMLDMLAKYYALCGVKNPTALARLAGATLDGITVNYVMDPENFPLNEVKEIVMQQFVDVAKK